MYHAKVTSFTSMVKGLPVQVNTDCASEAARRPCTAVITYNAFDPIGANLASGGAALTARDVKFSEAINSNP